MRNFVKAFLLLCCIGLFAGCGAEVADNTPNLSSSAPQVLDTEEPAEDPVNEPSSAFEPDSQEVQNGNPAQIDQDQELLGAVSPSDALEYMKNTPDLVIVEVNAPEWKLNTGFTGALYIPYTEMAERYDEIPSGRPVLLHCGGGIVSVDAYEILQEKRPDIPQLSYIAGAPPVSAYNEWLEGQK